MEIKYEEPENWQEVYEKIGEMRKLKTAPVDSMGCASWKEIASSPKDARVSTLWSLMLSSQTRDEMTADAMNNLAKSGVSVPSILALSDAELGEKIAKVGFHNKKVKYIKDTANILHTKYNDDIPDTLEGVLALPGVGKKMAFLLMTHAWDKPMGIGVDVHVHRICNRLGWVKTDTPEKTRVTLESWLPKEYWGKGGINKLLVGFGQTTCTPINPKCQTCTVNNICPSAFKKKETIKTTPNTKKRKKSELVKEEEYGEDLLKVNPKEKCSTIKQERVKSRKNNTYCLEDW